MSELDGLIVPEIKNDELYSAIRNVALDPSVRTILEIGSSSGEGSTRAFCEGILLNKEARLFCLEVSKPRFNKLVENYFSITKVHCFNMSSVWLRDFPTEEEVAKFYEESPSFCQLKRYPLPRVLGWLKQDMDYIKENNVIEGGVYFIKSKYKIDTFDVVLIDGSEFTGYKELEEVYGAKTIILDDINSFKNYQSYYELLEDENYDLICLGLNLRNGFAIFRRLENPKGTGGSLGK